MLATAVKLIFGFVIIKIMAIQLGVEQFGELSNFFSFITAMVLLSGGGIYSGVTKYISEYQVDYKKIKIYSYNALLIVIIFALLQVVIISIFKIELSNFLFNSDEYAYHLVITSLILVLIALSNLYQAFINGFVRTDIFFKLTTFGSCIGMLLLLGMVYQWSIDGAIIGIAVFYASPIFLASFYFFKKTKRNFRLLNSNLEKVVVKQYLNFALMALVTVMLFPTIQIVLRNIALENSDWNFVGNWQAVLRISDAYLQFIIVFLSVYYMPKLSRLNVKREISRFMAVTLVQVLLLVSLLSSIVYFLRWLIVPLLFSSEFQLAEELIGWQLVGDIFKVSCYTLGYYCVSKAKTKLYIIGELLQAFTLITISYCFVHIFGVYFLTSAYAATYVVLFILYFFIFLVWSLKGEKNLTCNGK